LRFWRNTRSFSKRRIQFGLGICKIDFCFLHIEAKNNFFGSWGSEKRKPCFADRLGTNKSFGETNTMNRLYVGNISYGTTDESLTTFFADAGEVTSAEVVMDKATGRSKGFAFVTMASDEAAQKAIDTLNGKMLDGRPIRIDFAKPKEDRPRGNFGGGGSGERRGGFGGGGRRGDRGGRGGDRSERSSDRSGRGGDRYNRDDY
jgi:RNA recognition motif-containing protein